MKAAHLFLAVLALAAAALLARDIIAVPAHVPLDPNEGWNAYHALAAMAGRGLYPPPGALMINNYPPLSFFLVGALGRITGDMIVAGLSERFAASRTAAIPSLWRKFQPYFYEWTGRAPEPGVAYGVCYHQSDAALDYMAGVETREGDDLPEGFTRLRIAPQTYAVFPHRGHISGLRATWGAIWDKWLPESGLKVVHAPFFERYGADFDGGAGEGGLEIWIAVEA